MSSGYTSSWRPGQYCQNHHTVYRYSSYHNHHDGHENQLRIQTQGKQASLHHETEPNQLAAGRAGTRTGGTRTGTTAATVVLLLVLLTPERVSPTTDEQEKNQHLIRHVHARRARQCTTSCSQHACTKLVAQKSTTGRTEDRRAEALLTNFRSNWTGRLTRLHGFRLLSTVV